MSWTGKNLTFTVTDKETPNFGRRLRKCSTGSVLRYKNNIHKIEITALVTDTDRTRDLYSDKAGFELCPKGLR